MMPPFLAQLSNTDIIGSDRWSGGGSSGLVVVALLLFLGLGVGAWYLSRRGTLVSRSQQQYLKILETRPLGGRQFLMVVAYGEERFLLSVCPGRVEYLCPLVQGPELDASEKGEGSSKELRFEDIVRGLIGKSEPKGN